ncbi:MAG: AAA family ATPase [Candidatus Micrarchaeota archaeon]|nr:AAA family ATPase [Candidatus Micrarchaeota archaeon]
MVLIAITGRRGSGKDTFADFMRDNYGFKTLDFSTDAINPILTELGLEITRKNLIDVATKTREREGIDFFAHIISDKIEEGSNYCVSGMRFVEELDYMKKRFGGNFILVALICDERNRYERIKKRGDRGEGDMTFDEFMEIEEKVTEKAIENLISRADYFIDNNGAIEDFYRNIATFAKSVLSVA